MIVTKNFTLAGRGEKKRRWKEDCMSNVLWYCRRCFSSAECRKMEYPHDPATFQARCTFRLALVGKYQYNYQQIEGFFHPNHRISEQQHLYLAANYTRSYQYKLKSETMTNTRNYELFIWGKGRKAFILNDGTKLLENLYRVMCEDMAFFWKLTCPGQYTRISSNPGRLLPPPTRLWPFVDTHWYIVLLAKMPKPPDPNKVIKFS